MLTGGLVLLAVPELFSPVRHHVDDGLGTFVHDRVTVKKRRPSAATSYTGAG